ncbi:MAG: tagaturonate epimerase family protein, partial [Bacteroidales bacterium]
VIDKALSEFDLPENLKLSVHSGSDKFSIYPVMGELIKSLDKGIHVKTAGTTWLEEIIGLALAGEEALYLAKSIYSKALARKDELCGSYSTVIDIDDSKLPSGDEVDSWDGEQFARTLRHIPDHPDYNPSFRQLIHVGYKIAAEYANVYISMIRRNEEIVAKQVSENIYERHLKRLFNL